MPERPLARPIVMVLRRQILSLYRDLAEPIELPTMEEHPSAVLGQLGAER